MDPVAHTVDDDQVAMEYDCPRCGRHISPDDGERVYGPCSSCRDELRAKFAAEPVTDFETERFEPKMNVVPNQVATKD